MLSHIRKNIIFYIEGVVKMLSYIRKQLPTTTIIFIVSLFISFTYFYNSSIKFDERMEMANCKTEIHSRILI